MANVSGHPTVWSRETGALEKRDVWTALRRGFRGRCPRCGASGSNRQLGLFYRGVVRSPIRAHTTGAARISQIVLDRVVRAIGATPQEGRTIVFTDSRDDAAGTAAGVELNHFRDLVRQLATAELERTDTPLAILRRAAAEASVEWATKEEE